MKRITLVSLVLTLCFGGLAPAALAKEVWVPVPQGTQIGYLCETYAPDRPVWGSGNCASSTLRLNDLSSKGARALKPGMWIRMDLTDSEVAFIEQKLGITLSSSAPIVTDPPYNQRPGVANENLGSNSTAQIPPAPADPELMRKLEELSRKLDNPPSIQVEGAPPRYFFLTVAEWAILGGIGIVIVLVLLVLLGISRIVRASQKFDEDMRKQREASLNLPTLKPGAKRDAMQILGQALAADEAAIGRLDGDLRQARSDIQTLQTRAETAEADLRREAAEAEAARAAAAKIAGELATKEKERAAADAALAAAKADAGTTKAELDRLAQEAESLRTQSENLKTGLTEANARADREADEAKTAKAEVARTADEHQRALQKIQNEGQRTLDLTNKELEKT